MKLQTFYLEVALCAKYINFAHCTATIVKMTRILISRKINLLFLACNHFGCADWKCCVICGGEEDLKCPADSYQGNGLEIYSSFLQTIMIFNVYQL